MNLVDTSGWVEYFFGGPNADFFASPIQNTNELIVPVICLYEVFKKVNAVGDEAKALQAVAQMKQGHVVNLTEALALKAALISLRHKLPMADSLIFASAQSRNATIWTQDEHFRSLPNVNFRQARTKASTRRQP
jgi:predicted nucleic acid-binding protein